MSSMKKDVTYFENPGEENTDAVLELSKKRAEELGIKHIVIASTRGVVGVKASKIFKRYNVIVVPHHVGFKETGVWELTEENISLIKQNGGKIYRGTQVFGNIDRAIRKKYSTYKTGEIVANTLRLFGEGMKVIAEIVAMAADSGLIPADVEVIGIAGTGKGADTAVVIHPANSSRFFDMYVKEIIAKPRKK